MKRLWNAFLYSVHGIQHTWRDEPAFRQEIILACVLIPLAFFLSPDAISLILMIGSLLLVLIAELVNTAIEATVDRISMEKHILAKKAKDTASAAVLIAIINAIMIWVVILFPKYFDFFA